MGVTLQMGLLVLMTCIFSSVYMGMRPGTRFDRSNDSHPELMYLARTVVLVSMNSSLVRDPVAPSYSGTREVSMPDPIEPTGAQLMVMEFSVSPSIISI
jgi:hypothetical protein